MSIGSIDPEQRHVAERLVLLALRRFHREQPLSVDLRMDALVTRVLAIAERQPSTRHRGGGKLELPEADLRRVIDDLVTKGKLARTGRRIRLADAKPGIDPAMAAKVATLLEGLRAAGAEPPRVDGIAGRLGIPPTVVDQLRAAGQLATDRSRHRLPRGRLVGASRPGRGHGSHRDDRPAAGRAAHLAATCGGDPGRCGPGPRGWPPAAIPTPFPTRQASCPVSAR